MKRAFPHLFLLSLLAARSAAAHPAWGIVVDRQGRVQPAPAGLANVNARVRGPAGELYVTDGQAVRRIDPDGVLLVLAFLQRAWRRGAGGSA